MSCLLTQSFAWDCKTESAGIRTIWIVDYNASDTVTKASGEISAHSLVNTRAYFRWDVPKETASLVAPIQVSTENHSVAYEATLTLKLAGVSTAKRNELKLAAKTRTRIIFLDWEGNYWMMGAVAGCEMGDGSQIEFGTALGDFKGAMVSFRHRENDTINLVQSSVISGLSLP